MDENSVTLSVNGVTFSWWKSVTIVMELTNITRQFTVAFTQDLSGKTAKPFEGLPRTGDAVECRIGNDTVITGYVTGTSSSYNANGVTLTISGASKTVDLVECTLPMDAPHRLAGVTPAAAAASLCAPYGVRVVDHSGVTDKVTLDVTPTKKIKSALEELAKRCSILMTDNAAGDLVLTKTGAEGTAADALRLGENVLQARREVKSAEVFSTYTVVGQSANAGSNLAVTANQTKAAATVSGMRRREFVYQQTGDVRQAAMQRRAQLLKNHALGASETFIYTVQGWRQSTGELWTPNSYVRIVDEIFNTDAVMLIDQVTLIKGNDGTTAELRCIHPEALLDTDEPELEKKASKTSNASMNFNAKGKTEQSASKWEGKKA